MDSVCPKGGGLDVSRIPPDYIDWCADCGVIEGLSISPTGVVHTKEKSNLLNDEHQAELEDGDVMLEDEQGWE